MFFRARVEELKVTWRRGGGVFFLALTWSMSLPLQRFGIDHLRCFTRCCTVTGIKCPPPPLPPRVHLACNAPGCKYFTDCG